MAMKGAAVQHKPGHSNFLIYLFRLASHLLEWQYFIFKSFSDYPVLRQSGSPSCLSGNILLRNTETRLAVGCTLLWSEKGEFIEACLVGVIRLDKKIPERCR